MVSIDMVHLGRYTISILFNRSQKMKSQISKKKNLITRLLKFDLCNPFLLHILKHSSFLRVKLSIHRIIVYGVVVQNRVCYAYQLSLMLFLLFGHSYGGLWVFPLRILQGTFCIYFIQVEFPIKVSFDTLRRSQH